MYTYEVDNNGNILNASGNIITIKEFKNDGFGYKTETCEKEHYIKLIDIVQMNGPLEKFSYYDDYINDMAEYERHTAVPVDELLIPEGVTRISCNFKEIKARRIVIPEGVNVIEQSSFEEDEYLESVVFPTSLQIIEEKAFMRCKNLSETNLKDLHNLDSIWKFAFRETALTEVVIPDSVTYCGRGCFMKIPTLKRMIIGKGIDTIPPSFCDCIEMDPEDDFLTEVFIPETVKEVHTRAFSQARFSELKLPDGLEYIGSQAFSSCINLKQILIPQKIKTISEGTFWGCKNLNLLSLPHELEEIEKNSFNDCQTLNLFVIPPKVKYIEENVFEEFKPKIVIIQSKEICRQIKKRGVLHFKEDTTVKMITDI